MSVISYFLSILREKFENFTWLNQIIRKDKNNRFASNFYLFLHISHRSTTFFHYLNYSDNLKSSKTMFNLLMFWWDKYWYRLWYVSIFYEHFLHIASLSLEQMTYQNNSIFLLPIISFYSRRQYHYFWIESIYLSSALWPSKESQLQLFWYLYCWHQ